MVTAESAIASRPRAVAVSLVVIAFLCGSAVGAVGMRAYAFRVARTAVWRTEVREHTLQRWRKKLSLTDEQVAQLALILDDFNKYYDDVSAEGHERILQVLTPEQRTKFQKMMQER